ncbi:MAG: hypothetical protein NVS4B11_07860 [Ktedonobacteraceae bacterium]
MLRILLSIQVSPAGEKECKYGRFVLRSTAVNVSGRRCPSFFWYSSALFEEALARYAIMGFVALIALEQLGIAPALLNILFTAIMGTAALAAGLAFGLGGQDTARKYLARTESAASTAAAQVQAQQSMNRAQTLSPSRPEVPRAR